MSFQEFVEGAPASTMAAMPSVLVIDDEPALARRLGRALEESGHQVHTAECGADGVAAVAKHSPDLVLLDLRLPDASGLDVLDRIVATDRNLPVVLMTAYGSVQDAVEAMRRGAADYLAKPIDLDKLRHLVRDLVTRQRTQRELDYHRARSHPESVIGDDPRLHEFFDQIERLRNADLPPGERPAILLTGETGTGKGVIARAIHERLAGEAPFIEVNCTAMPASMIEAELFGHERGSFTDARSSRAGLFEAAHGGTILLDEIGHLAIDLQANFLRVIEDKKIRRIGSTRERSTDVHVIAATNRDLARAVAEGDFRDDLLHRLRVLSFEIPPLRSRSKDIVRLARHFASLVGAKYVGEPVTVRPDAERLLLGYAWPGNVRELSNVIERAVLLSGQRELGPEVLESLFSVSHAHGAAVPFALPDGGVRLEEVERTLIEQALERTSGNRTQASRLLGLTRHALRYRMEKHELE